MFSLSMRSVDRGILLGALLAATLNLGSVPARADDDGGLSFEALRSALVHVGHAPDGNAVQWLGTGFLVDDDCTVVTAKHILKDIDIEAMALRMVDLRRETTMTFKGTVLHESPKTDLAFLRFQGSSIGATCSSRSLSQLQLTSAFDERWTGQSVDISGFAVLERDQRGDIPIFRRGIIASSELRWEGQPMLLLDLTGVPGLSGAPVVLRSTGEVIGVVFGPGRTERQYDLEWATPITRADLKRAKASGKRKRRGG